MSIKDFSSMTDPTMVPDPQTVIKRLSERATWYAEGASMYSSDEADDAAYREMHPGGLAEDAASDIRDALNVINSQSQQLAAKDAQIAQQRDLIAELASERCADHPDGECEIVCLACIEQQFDEKDAQIAQLTDAAARDILRLTRERDEWQERAGRAEAALLQVRQDGWPFNVNEYVRVRLNDYGRQILGNGHRTIPHEADGWSRWQLWDLVSTFGAYVHLGVAPPFETDIRIELSGAGHDQALNPDPAKETR
jgi:hypothetical protein